MSISRSKKPQHINFIPNSLKDSADLSKFWYSGVIQSLPRGTSLKLLALKVVIKIADGQITLVEQSTCVLGAVRIYQRLSSRLHRDVEFLNKSIVNSKLLKKKMDLKAGVPKIQRKKSAVLLSQQQQQQPDEMNLVPMTINELAEQHRREYMGAEQLSVIPPRDETRFSHEQLLLLDQLEELQQQHDIGLPVAYGYDSNSCVAGKFDILDRDHQHEFLKSIEDLMLSSDRDFAHIHDTFQQLDSGDLNVHVRDTHVNLSEMGLFGVDPEAQFDAGFGDMMLNAQHAGPDDGILFDDSMFSMFKTDFDLQFSTLTDLSIQPTDKLGLSLENTFDLDIPSVDSQQAKKKRPSIVPPQVDQQGGEGAAPRRRVQVRGQRGLRGPRYDTYYRKHAPKKQIVMMELDSFVTLPSEFGEIGQVEAQEVPEQPSQELYRLTEGDMVETQSVRSTSSLVLKSPLPPQHAVNVSIMSIDLMSPQQVTPVQHKFPVQQQPQRIQNLPTPQRYPFQPLQQLDNSFAQSNIFANLSITGAPLDTRTEIAQENDLASISNSIFFVNSTVPPPPLMTDADPESQLLNATIAAVNANMQQQYHQTSIPVSNVYDFTSHIFADKSDPHTIEPLPTSFDVEHLIYGAHKEDEEAEKSLKKTKKAKKIQHIFDESDFAMSDMEEVDLFERQEPAHKQPLAIPSHAFGWFEDFTVTTTALQAAATLNLHQHEVHLDTQTAPLLPALIGMNDQVTFAVQNPHMKPALLNHSKPLHPAHQPAECNQADITTLQPDASIQYHTIVQQNTNINHIQQFIMTSALEQEFYTADDGINNAAIQLHNITQHLYPFNPKSISFHPRIIQPLIDAQTVVNHDSALYFDQVCNSMALSLFTWYNEHTGLYKMGEETQVDISSDHKRQMHGTYLLSSIGDEELSEIQISSDLEVLQRDITMVERNLLSSSQEEIIPQFSLIGDEIYPGYEGQHDFTLDEDFGVDIIQEEHELPADDAIRLTVEDMELEKQVFMKYIKQDLHQLALSYPVKQFSTYLLSKEPIWSKLDTDSQSLFALILQIIYDHHIAQQEANLAKNKKSVPVPYAVDIDVLVNKILLYIEQTMADESKNKNRKANKLELQRIASSTFVLLLHLFKHELVQLIQTDAYAPISVRLADVL